MKNKYVCLILGWVDEHLYVGYAFMAYMNDRLMTSFNPHIVGWW